MVAASKPWWQSKTVWANVALFVLAIIPILSHSAVFVGVPHFGDGLALIGAIVNIVLRFVTNQPITAGPQP